MHACSWPRDFAGVVTPVSAAMADRVCLTNVGIVLHHTSYTIRSSSSEFAYPIVLQHTRFVVLGSSVCGASLQAMADKTTVVAVIIQARWIM